MKYKYMDLISDGIIVKKLNSKEILYANQSIKRFLKISENNQNISEINKLLSGNDILISCFEKSQNDIDMEIGGNVETTDLQNNLLFLSYKCTWFDKEDDLVIYTFRKISDTYEVAENLPSATMVIQTVDNLKILYANEKHYQILGIDTRIGHDDFFEDYIYEEDRDWVTVEIYNNLHDDVDIDIEFRVKTNYENMKWVRFFAKASLNEKNEKLLYATLKDLSVRRDINERLHLERVLFHKITELTNEIFFRLDLKTNTIYFIGKPSAIFTKNKDMLRNKTIMENFPQCILETDLIYKEDIPQFLDAYEYAKRGIYKSIEIRSEQEDGTLEWYKIIYNFVKDDAGKPMLITGKLINNSDHKLLEEQATKDLLTGFYNKISTEIEITRLINDEEIEGQHALMIIDIDNFKGINDNLGHLFGDNVLNEVSKNIKA